MKKTIFEQKERNLYLVWALLGIGTIIGILLLLVLPLITIDVGLLERDYSCFDILEGENVSGIFLVFLGGALMGVCTSCVMPLIEGVYNENMAKLGVTERKMSNGKSVKLKVRSKNIKILYLVAAISALVFGIVFLVLGKAVVAAQMQINSDFVSLGAGVIAAIVFVCIHIVAMVIVGAIRMNFLNSVDKIEE